MSLPDSGAPASAPIVTESAPISESADQSLEASAGLEEAVEETPVEESKVEKEKRLKKYKLQVNKKEREIELDLDNDEEVSKYIQKAMAADEKFAESAEIRKAAVQFIEELRKNPRKVLSDPNIGVDLKAMAQEIINESIEDERKSPEQKEIENLKKQLEARLEQDKEERSKREQAEFERLQADAEQKLESGISSALEGGNLPKTPYTVKKMAEIMMIALQNDIELSPQEVVPILRKQMQNDIKQMFASSSDDVLEEFLDKGIQDRLRKRNLAKAKKNVETASQVKSTGQQALEAKKDEKPKEKIPMKKFFGF